MSVRMRHTRSHTKNRRSHHALGEARLSACSNCGSAHLRHRMCDNCGSYKGRDVVDIASKIARKEKRHTEKMKSLGVEDKEVEGEDKEKSKALSAEKLSKK